MATKSNHSLHSKSKGFKSVNAVQSKREAAVLRYKLKIGKLLAPDTPSKIVGHKEPLRKIDGGFGYFGTIAHDESEEYTQCHICGYFFPQLGRHVTQAHDISVKEYKLKHGLTVSTTLVAPKARSRWVKQYEKLTPEQKKARFERLKNNRGTGGGGRKKSLERMNKEGKCPDQLIEKIKDLHAMVGCTPSETDCKEILGHGWHSTIIRSFGTWNNAVKLAGLKPNEIGGGFNARYSAVQAIAMLRDFKEGTGREPFATDTRQGQLPSITVYTRLFGSWTKAKQEAFR